MAARYFESGDGPGNEVVCGKNVDSSFLPLFSFAVLRVAPKVTKRLKQAAVGRSDFSISVVLLTL